MINIILLKRILGTILGLISLIKMCLHMLFPTNEDNWHQELNCDMQVYLLVDKFDICLFIGLEGFVPNVIALYKKGSSKKQQDLTFIRYMCVPCVSREFLILIPCTKFCWKMSGKTKKLSFSTLQNKLNLYITRPTFCWFSHKD